MRRVLLSLIGLVLGYASGVLAGLALVTLASPNTHDKSVEMVMTAAFVTGPLAAIVGLVAALVFTRRKPV